jgi:hypothetical protein
MEVLNGQEAQADELVQLDWRSGVSVWQLHAPPHLYLVETQAAEMSVIHVGPPRNQPDADGWIAREVHPRDVHERWQLGNYINGVWQPVASNDIQEMVRERLASPELVTPAEVERFAAMYHAEQAHAPTIDLM